MVTGAGDRGKHLEHADRKVGVRNLIAAAALLGSARAFVVPRGEPVDSWPTGLPHGSAGSSSKQGLPG
jgi:hypothetical protein